MVTPTVGRIVWFWTGNPDQEQPRAAIICFVHTDDDMVNLHVFDENGYGTPMENVPLLQGGEGIVAGNPYCVWMPYQKAQAAKQARLGEPIWDDRNSLEPDEQMKMVEQAAKHR